MIFETRIVARGEDRHRQAVWLDAFLVEIAFDLLERASDDFEGFVPAPGAFDIDDRLRGQRGILAECVAGLCGRSFGCAWRGWIGWARFCLSERRRGNR